MRRNLGPNGPSLSQITYGSMRMSESPDRPEPLKVLLQLHDAGVDTHHSSSEYDSYPLYLETLRELRETGRSVHHIVKLAEPSFDDVEFDAARMRKAVDARLRELGTEQLAVVQWMVRTPDPVGSNVPLEVVHRQRCEITAAFEDLERTGKIGAFAVFPYTLRFAFAVEHELEPRAFCSYLSLFESDYLDLLAAGRPFIALRPFAGAQPDVENAPETARVEPDMDRRYEAALRYPLLHPNVATVVVSVNQQHHVDLAIAVAQEATPDLDAFEQTNVEISGQIVKAGS